LHIHAWLQLRNDFFSYGSQRVGAKGTTWKPSKVVAGLGRCLPSRVVVRLEKLGVAKIRRPRKRKEEISCSGLYSSPIVLSFSRRERDVVKVLSKMPRQKKIGRQVHKTCVLLRFVDVYAKMQYHQVRVCLSAFSCSSAGLG
jgi:hypothetical protein